MQQVLTEEGSGENDAQVSPFNPPQLQEFIATQLGEINNLYNKLIGCGIKNIKTLIYIDNDDLKELCNELKLSFSNKMKFKAEIRELKDLYKPKKEIANQSFITITENEQFYLNKLQLLLKQSNDLKYIFATHSNQIDNEIINAKTKIDNTINNIIKTLKIRQKTLHTKVN